MKNPKFRGDWVIWQGAAWYILHQVGMVKVWAKAINLEHLDQTVQDEMETAYMAYITNALLEDE